MNFLPVKDFEGFYEVSDTGIVRSLDRTLLTKAGYYKHFKGKILKPTINKQTGYYTLSLWKNNKQFTFSIHSLVARTFIPLNIKGLEVNHIDGNKLNNNVSNLEWVTSSENSYHAVDNGLRTYTNRLTREEFITCLEDVINGESYYSLSLRVPYKVPYLSVKLRKLARELGKESLLNDSLKLQRLERAQKNGITFLK